MVGKVTGSGVGQLASGIPGAWAGLLGGVTNDGDVGESGMSMNLGVGGLEFTTGSVGAESNG